MNSNCSRRQFLKSSTAAASAFALSSPSMLRAEVPTKRTAVDLVSLGSTGLKLSRLGMGTGSNNGHTQTAIGKEGFTKLIHYAYDQGIRFFDCSETYATFTWLGDALKGLPREQLFIQSKITAKPSDMLATIDHHRQTYRTDYIDSMLVHCQFTQGWTDQWKSMRDAFDQAREKKWILAKGVSCHSLPALREAVATDWTQVHLVRINPQGRRMDSMDQEMWNNADPTHEVAPVVAELKKMRAKNRGVIGMKICGNGQFVDAADREKSIRFAMSLPELDAVAIGFKNNAEVDEAIQRINAALA
jgi:predicted aldo/keto reductase-like oxidoreductase